MSWDWPTEQSHGRTHSLSSTPLHKLTPSVIRCLGVALPPPSVSKRLSGQGCPIRCMMWQCWAIPFVWNGNNVLMEFFSLPSPLFCIVRWCQISFSVVRHRTTLCKCCCPRKHRQITEQQWEGSREHNKDIQFCEYSSTFLQNGNSFWIVWIEIEWQMKYGKHCAWWRRWRCLSSVSNWMSLGWWWDWRLA